MISRPYLPLTVGGLLLLALAGVIKPSARLIYNTSESAPLGWYLVRPAEELTLGQYVLARLPHDVAALAAVRGYLPRGVPILKRIAALPGQQLCTNGSSVEIDARVVVQALDGDHLGRALPHWHGCRTLLADELFLLNADHADSFDSRYFGPLDRSFVQGIAVRLSTLRER